MTCLLLSQSHDMLMAQSHDMLMAQSHDPLNLRFIFYNNLYSINFSIHLLGIGTLPYLQEKGYYSYTIIQFSSRNTLHSVV